MIARRALAAALGLVVALATLEIGLRIANAIAVSGARERLRAGDAEGRPIVAFVGDSNVYGLYFERDQAIDRVVQRLSRAGGKRGVHTVNFGLPASPSWTVIGQVREALALHPVAVVACCGINNYSTVPPGEGLGFLEGLRIVKATRLALANWRRRDAQAIDLPSGPGGEPIQQGSSRDADGRSVFFVKPRDGDSAPLEVERLVNKTYSFGQVEARLRSDLLEMAALVKAAGSRFVIQTYLAGLDPGFAEITRLELALDDHDGVVVADCARTCERALSESGPSVEARTATRALLLTKDQHPTPLGYEVEGRVVAYALRGIGVLPDLARENPLAPLAAARAAPPVLRLAGGDGLAFEIEGRPDDLFSLVIGPAGRSSYAGTDVPVDVTVFDQSIGALRGELTVRADAKGNARLEVPAAVRTLLRSTLRGDLRAACVVTRGGRGGAAQVMTTAAVPVSL